MGRHRQKGTETVKAWKALDDIKARHAKEAENQKRDAEIKPGQRQTPLMQDEARKKLKRS